MDLHPISFPAPYDQTTDKSDPTICTVTQTDFATAAIWSVSIQMGGIGMWANLYWS